VLPKESGEKMKKKYFWLSVFVGVVIPASAFAEGLSVQNFRAANNSSFTLSEDASLELWPREANRAGWNYSFAANYTWVSNPLIENAPDHVTKLIPIVSAMNTIELGGTAMLANQMAFSVNVPLTFVSLQSGGSRTSLGDVRLSLKYRVTGDKSPVQVALIPELHLPTGDSTIFAGDGSFGAGARVSVERDFGRFRAVVNAGYFTVPNARFRDLDYSQKLPLSAAVYVPIDAQGKWSANVEAAGAVLLPVRNFTNPIEAYAGARYRATRELMVNAGAGTGAISSGSGNEFRLVLGVRFVPALSSSIPDDEPVSARTLSSIQND
jgi:hypothetical protein